MEGRREIVGERRHSRVGFCPGLDQGAGRRRAGQAFQPPSSVDIGAVQSHSAEANFEWQEAVDILAWVRHLGTAWRMRATQGVYKLEVRRRMEYKKELGLPAAATRPIVGLSTT